jgi:hypothetical protein
LIIVIYQENQTQDTGQKKKNADATRAAEAPLRRRTDNRGLKLVIDCERY